ncbi:response regulator [Nitrospira sp. T9]|uniref:response regulator n=1 Tax=unclassified Nitrospira TaxID=2652172 RepID=UPI003F9CF5DC
MNRILLIDDDIQVRESVSLSLETAGYTVMAAGSCREGLQNHENFQASLIIMDVLAMEEREDELTAPVLEQSSSIPMITLTGNIPASGGRMKGPHQIFQPICTLQKPFTVDELLQTVQRALVGYVGSSPVPVPFS